MTFKEAKEAYTRNPVVLIPLGSIEEHGPTTPVGDYRVAEALSLQIAAATNSISIPTLPFGVGEPFRNFPGGISLRKETLYAVMWDTCISLLDHGLDHLLLICGHHGNVPVVEDLAWALRKERGIRIAMIEPFRWFTPQLLKELYGQESPAMGHGTEPMTSVILHLFPEDLRMDLAEKEVRNAFHGLKIRNLQQVEFEGVGINIYLNMDEFTPNGVLGDISLAKAEVGEKMLKRFAEIAARFVERFRTIDTHS